MKQKLLNLFTWRATLLVALLCTSFGSAWGQTTSNITFTVGENSWPTNDGITWSTATGSPSVNGGVLQSNATFSVKSNSLTGIIKKITVNAYLSGGNPSGNVVVEIGNTSLGSKDLSTSTSANYEFTPSTEYVDGKILNVTINKNSGNKNCRFNLKSITVTYVSKATIPAPGALDKDANPAKYYGTYSNKCQFVVHEGLTVSTVSVADGELSVTDYNYDQDNPKIIPANTGVMISASNNTDTYTVDLKLATVPAIDGNMLRPTGDNGITATAMGNADSGCLFYYLTINSENDQIGFYRRVADDPDTEENEEGSAFPMPANKAYLAVPSGQVGNVKGYTFGDGTNGIKAVETEKAESNAIYNLAGQRVSKMQKGLYIVNGKKMIQR